jgi:hypothetical protein
MSLFSRLSCNNCSESLIVFWLEMEPNSKQLNRPIRCLCPPVDILDQPWKVSPAHLFIELLPLFADELFGYAGIAIKCI